MATGLSITLLLGGCLGCGVLPIAAGIQGRRWRKLLEDAILCDSTLIDIARSSRFAIVKPTHLLVCGDGARFFQVPHSPYMRHVLGIEGGSLLGRQWRRISTACVIAWAVHIPFKAASKEERLAACARLPRGLRPHYLRG